MNRIDLAAANQAVESQAAAEAGRTVASQTDAAASKDAANARRPTSTSKQIDAARQTVVASQTDAAKQVETTASRAETASPDAVASQIASARSRIAELLLEIDDIVLQVNPQIEADYATKIGYLENGLLKWQIAARRARRRFSLAQARANAGETFTVSEFEAQLDSELAEWESLLDESSKAFLRAAERIANVKPLSPVESRELKSLHRTLIKRLHPDLHPNQSEEAVRFFAIAQTAYERGNLDLLRSVAVATEGMGDAPNDNPPDISNLSDGEAAIELEITLAHERVTEQRLEELKRSNPYALGEKLEDGAWVIGRTSELKRQIEEQKEATRAYDDRFHELARRCEHEQQHEQ